MNRSWMKLAGGLMSLTLALGCRNARKDDSCCGARVATAPTASVVSAPITQSSRRPALVSENARLAPPPRSLPAMSGIAVAQAPVNVEQSAPPTPPVRESVVAPAKPIAKVVESSKAPSIARQERAPTYFNSPDYSILFGTLDHNARTGVWRLRYADAGDEDRYGGCVTLEGVTRQMGEFRSGQIVRIEGALSNPDSRDPSPAYKVRDVRRTMPEKE